MKKLVCALAVLIPLSAQAREVREFERDFDARDAERLVVDIPIGELSVQGSSGDAIEAKVSIDCRFRESRCRELAEDVDLVIRQRGSELVLELEGIRSWKSLGLELEIEMKAPARLALEVDFGVGELEIAGFENDITVDQGIGELNVRMDSSTVDTVDIDAGIGDAMMRYPGGKLSTAGVFGNDLRWSDGSGSARVLLDLGIGEVDLRLK